MTVKCTAKQDGFAQLIAAGDLPDNACYRAHYDCSRMSPEAVSVEASRLMRVPKVALRIDELRAMFTHEIVKIRVWDQSRFIDEAEQNLAQARELGQMAPANGALTLIGKVTGIVQESAPVTDTALEAIIKVASALSDAQLRGLAAGRNESTIEGSFELLPEDEAASEA